MFGLDVQIDTRGFDRIPVATDKAAFRNFTHGGARVSKDMKASIVTDDEPSAEGTPPHTRGQSGHNLRTAIRFDATKHDAKIGPIASMVGEVGAAHEFGEEFHGQEFDERPFAWPALEKNIDRFASDWAGSIGD